MTADEPAMGPDFDFQDGGVLGTAEGGKGSAAAPAQALLRGEFVLFADGGEVGVVTAARARPAGLLAAPSAGRRGRVRGGWNRGGSGAGLGLRAEELLLAETELGAELFDLLLEEGLPLHGAVVHGLPVAGLTPGLELHGEARADRTGAVGKGGRRAGQVRERGGQGDPRRVRADRRTGLGCHANRSSPDSSAGQRS
jgi:hypothetical protein